ncbi:charged multivesicular body protein 4c isoform X2 [Bos indicus x Bos taurus]|uniref:charged multivesicular body protein 4c isoform X2 n=1 Tax=Bos indicus x Bos taurus TaxID=30522 RepID=UPI000F7D14A1|nr:charged multivesicular body protein 4c isoform X2 [Bos indicus x Bos taurus]
MRAGLPRSRLCAQPSRVSSVLDALWAFRTVVTELNPAAAHQGREELGEENDPSASGASARGSAALQALKRKKRLEKQLTQIDGTLSTIEFQREALENSYTNTEVLKNMGLAAKAMKAVHENMDLNKIDDLMQEITEQQDIAQEISEAFSQRVGFGDDFDEDELMAELEELEQEELNKKMTNIRLPNAPSSSLPAQPDRGSGRMPGAPSARRSRAASSRRTEGEDDDIQHLAAWAT